MNLSEIKTIPYRDRIPFLRQFISKTSQGMEIGPSHAPIAPKKSGYQVIIIDALSTKDLQDKYKNLDVNTEQIEHVDYIWQGENLSDIIPDKNNLNYILASHVIEHIPNFLSFFQQSQVLLNQNGRLILAIPDKRKCFDYFRPISTTGQILQAFHENRTTHMLSAVFDNHANHAMNEEHSTWFSSTKAEPDKTITLQSNVYGAYQLLQQAIKDHKYYDVHGWVFTPSSFLLIIKDLTDLGLLKLNLEEFYLSDGHEFYAIFSPSDKKTGLLNKLDRQQLHRQITNGL